MEHAVERRIMWGDLDSLGIVFYPRYYEWIDASGHLFFEALGLSLGEMLRKRGLIFGLAETSCRYRMPGTYHQRVRIVTRLQDLQRKTLTLSHVIALVPGEKTLAEGMEKRICLDTSNPPTFKAVSIPEDIYEVLKRAVSK